jgi:hypothetical protein
VRFKCADGTWDKEEKKTKPRNRSANLAPPHTKFRVVAAMFSRKIAASFGVALRKEMTRISSSFVLRNGQIGSRTRRTPRNRGFAPSRGPAGPSGRLSKPTRHSVDAVKRMSPELNARILKDGPLARCNDAAINVGSPGFRGTPLCRDGSTDARRSPTETRRAQASDNHQITLNNSGQEASRSRRCWKLGGPLRRDLTYYC